MDANTCLCRVIPYLHCSSFDAKWDICQAALDFYQKCGTSNPYVVVRSGLNISNPNGERPEQKGLFALQDLEAGQRCCFYSGEVYNACSTWGAYILRVADNLFIDAERDTHDVGYLWCVPNDSGLLKAPLNHGRYVNTVFPSDYAAGRRINCEFVLDESGADVVWLQTSRVIAAGEELLADYGEWYLVGSTISQAHCQRDVLLKKRRKC